ncbi:hypothetical protein EES42_41755 [Streptomyces sp. ADI95-17]|nr:hypothetical protein EES42_41755 [Streptomyces sp. ADI95-17]
MPGRRQIPRSISPILTALLVTPLRRGALQEIAHRRSVPLSQTGNLATMAAAAGIDYDQLIRMILATATTSGGYRP